MVPCAAALPPAWSIELSAAPAGTTLALAAHLMHFFSSCSLSHSYMSGSTRAERRALQEEQRQQKALSALSDQACEVRANRPDAVLLNPLCYRNATAGARSATTTTTAAAAAADHDMSAAVTGCAPPPCPCLLRQVVLVRHGETQWNVEQRLQGQLVPGPGLTERGQQQAAVLAARLRCERFDAIYSSDLLRATQTAEAVIAARATHTAAEADGGDSDCNGSGNECGSRGGSRGGSGGASEPPAGAAGEATDGAGHAQHSALPLLRLDPRLRERNLGLLQGLTRAEAARQHPQAYDALSADAGAAAVEVGAAVPCQARPGLPPVLP